MKPTLAELDARIARTQDELGRANGEAYTELLTTLAALQGMRARIKAERHEAAVARLHNHPIHEAPRADCSACRLELSE